MKRKIALEEHFTTEENNKLWDAQGESSRNGKAYMQQVEANLLDVNDRLARMDANGIEATVLSLTSPGVQSILDSQLAIDFAQRTNDLLYSKYLETHPDRLFGFAAVPLQDPAAAADELERSVKELGMLGALINGYTNIGDSETGQYLDEEPMWEFWDRVASLDVPVYLHPREPLPSQREAYRGYSSLVGSAWGFGVETSTHAVRLMMSGLFDKYPNLQIILGHLGEGLPILLPRLEWRLQMQKDGEGLGQAQKPLSHYFNKNFSLTTSGHFHSKSLHNAIAEIGIDRLMFSVDYPYEDMESAVKWFDNALLSENDRGKIGRTNAQRLLNIP
ncbi:amidohydrolase [Pseudomonas sp. v388]|uniref:amidohydrolase family protein n=1 Tax=Pseudomonas sp. v388 TaxID=2479849 RepID=UPI000F7AC2B4|nr:amidohydrolase family protein [Pseudomonas sp. v388]RRV10535.1 amidohydrolase [Pseudomonas sp. v388]